MLNVLNVADKVTWYRTVYGAFLEAFPFINKIQRKHCPLWIMQKRLQSKALDKGMEVYKRLSRYSFTIVICPEGPLVGTYTQAYAKFGSVVSYHHGNHFPEKVKRLIPIVRKHALLEDRRPIKSRTKKSE